MIKNSFIKSLSIVFLLICVFSCFNVNSFAASENEVKTVGEIDKYEFVNNLPYKYSSKDEGYVATAKSQNDTLMSWAYTSTNVASINAAKKYNLNPQDVNFDANFLDRAAQELEYGIVEDERSIYRLTTALIPEQNIARSRWTEDNFIYKSLQNKYAGNIIGCETRYTSNIAEIKQMVYHYGAVYANVSRDKGNFSSDYKYYNEWGTGEILNKLKRYYIQPVAIIGWDDTISKNNFPNNAKNNGAFLCLNDIETDYGNFVEYYWLSYDSFGIKENASKCYRIFTAYNYNIDFPSDAITYKSSYITYDGEEEMYCDKPMYGTVSFDKDVYVYAVILTAHKSQIQRPLKSSGIDFYIDNINLKSSGTLFNEFTHIGDGMYVKLKNPIKFSSGYHNITVENFGNVSIDNVKFVCSPSKLKKINILWNVNGQIISQSYYEGQIALRPKQITSNEYKNKLVTELSGEVVVSDFINENNNVSDNPNNNNQYNQSGFDLFVLIEIIVNYINSIISFIMKLMK